MPPGCTPQLEDEAAIYRVQVILNSRWWGQTLEYLIDWEDYSPEEPSWVALDDILDPAVLTQFHAEHQDSPAPRGRGRHRRHTIRPSGATLGGGGTVTDIHLRPH